MSAPPKSGSAGSRSVWVNGRQDGDTLVEVLIAVVVIALCAVAILGALTTTLSSSGEHRSLAADDAILTSFAEQVKEVVELGSNPTWPGTSSSDCPSSGTLTQWYQKVSDIPVPSPFTTSGASYPLTLTNVPFSGYKVSIPATYEVSGNSTMPGNSTTWCSTVTTGIQEVTLSVTAPTGVSDSLNVVVRKQNDGSA